MYRSISIISAATVDDLEDIGILKGHAIMIARAIDLNWKRLEALEKRGVPRGDAIMMLREEMNASAQSTGTHFGKLTDPPFAHNYSTTFKICAL